MSGTDWTTDEERLRLERAGATPQDAERILNLFGLDKWRPVGRNMRHMLIGYACTMLTHNVSVDLIVTVDSGAWFDLSDASARTHWTAGDLERVTRRLLETPQDPDMPLDALSDLATSTTSADHALEVIDAAGTYDLADAAWLAAGGITSGDIAWVAATMPERGLPGTDTLEQIAKIDEPAIRRLVLAMVSGPDGHRPVPELHALAGQLDTGYDIALRLILDNWTPRDAVTAAHALDRRAETSDTGVRITPPGRPGAGTRTRT